MTVKHCFKCGITLNKQEVIQGLENQLKLPLSKAQENWHSPHVQFFCCDCYDIYLDEMDPKRVKKILNDEKKTAIVMRGECSECGGHLKNDPHAPAIRCKICHLTFYFDNLRNAKPMKPKVRNVEKWRVLDVFYLFKEVKI